MNVQLKDRPTTDALPRKTEPVPVGQPSIQTPNQIPGRRSRRRAVLVGASITAIVAGLTAFAATTDSSVSDEVTPTAVVAPTPDHFSPGGNSLAPTPPQGTPAAEVDYFSPGGNSLAPARPLGTRALPSDYFTPGSNSLSDGSR